MNKKLIFISVSFFLFVLVLTAYETAQDGSDTAEESESIYIDHVEADIENFSKDWLRVFKLSQEDIVVDLENSEVPKRISEWKEEGDEVLLNGAYFEEDFSPSGMLVINNEKLHKTRFSQDYSGLIEIRNGVISIRDLRVNPLKEEERFESALQSFPFLIRDSKGGIAKDSGLKARRTAIGLDKDNNLYIFAVTEEMVSLFEMMQKIQELDIPFTYVLNLDGGPSTGLSIMWNTTEFFEESETAVPSILRITHRN